MVSEPKADRLYVMEDDEQININALVNDTWAIGKVEFLLDGAVIGTATVAPFNERWKITMRDQAVEGGAPWPAFTSDDPEVQPGTIVEYGDGFAAARTAGGVYLEGHMVGVKAFDRAGNEVVSDEIRVWVRHRKETD
ncbi:MAG: Ig-like domain-containing protein [Caldilineaceae bacterium]